MLLGALRAAFVERRGSDHFAGFVDAKGIAERSPRYCAQIMHFVERRCGSLLLSAGLVPTCNSRNTKTHELAFHAILSDGAKDIYFEHLVVR